MKIIRLIFTFVFALIIILPMAYFNFTPNAVSEIDNRKLAENPFTVEGEFTENLENYVNDRIGFRTEMITEYLVLNDRLFGVMSHPSYSAGKDGYVFGAGVWVDMKYSSFHDVFINMLVEIQKYCEERGVPFLFVFNPAKPAIYQDKLVDGIVYDRNWVDQFFDKLDEKGINYLDNTGTFKELRKQDIHTYNQKYDANHWNETGAFYGTQNMLKKIKEEYPNVHVNSLTDYTFSYGHRDSLSVSKFPIDEYVPYYKPSVSYKNVIKNYDGLSLHPSYKTCGYYICEERKADGSPKTLVFQGSYMNSSGYKFLASALGEYVSIHDYQNVIDFPYYFNIFKPEYVIFEVAEYTVKGDYFSTTKMKKIDYNPPRESVDVEKISQLEFLTENLTVEQGETLTVITLKTDEVYKYLWLNLTEDYDMKKVENGYQVTLETARYLDQEENLKIFAYSE